MQAFQKYPTSWSSPKSASKKQWKKNIHQWKHSFPAIEKFEKFAHGFQGWNWLALKLGWMWQMWLKRNRMDTQVWDGLSVLAILLQRAWMVQVPCFLSHGQSLTRRVSFSKQLWSYVLWLSSCDTWNFEVRVTFCITLPCNGMKRMIPPLATVQYGTGAASN